MTKRIVTLADWSPTLNQVKLINKVLKTGRLTYGPFTQQLEEEFAKKHNFNYCIFMNSGTSALDIAWHYLADKHNWPDKSEIIVPAITFVATVNMILINGFRPVLVDIDPDTFNINPALIEKAITKKTKAICAVDLLGRPCDIVSIKKIAKKHKLMIIEDSCESMFVTHSNGQPVGSEADIAIYSSYLAHIISTGVGGFLCTNSKEDSLYMRSLIWHGRDNLYLNMDANKTVPMEKLMHARFKFNKLGFNYRLTELEAALGIDEVKRSENILIARHENAALLKKALLEVEDYVKLPNFDDDNAWMYFPIICKEGVNRDELALFLERRGIQTRWIMPLTNQPIYKNIFKESDYPVAQMINKQGLLLGIHPFLNARDIRYIAKCFKEYFNVK